MAVPCPGRDHGSPAWGRRRPFDRGRRRGRADAREGRGHHRNRRDRGSLLRSEDGTCGPSEDRQRERAPAPPGRNNHRVQGCGGGRQGHRRPPRRIPHPSGLRGGVGGRRPHRVHVGGIRTLCGCQEGPRGRHGHTRGQAHRAVRQHIHRPGKEDGARRDLAGRAPGLRQEAESHPLHVRDLGVLQEPLRNRVLGMGQRHAHVGVQPDVRNLRNPPPRCRNCPTHPRSR